MKNSELDAVAGLIAAPIAAGAARGAAAAGSVIRAPAGAGAWAGAGTATAASFATVGAAVSGPGLVPTAPAGCGVFNAAGLAPPAVCGAAGSAATGCVGSVSATGAGFEIESRPTGGLPVTPGGNGGNSSAAGGKGSDLVFGPASSGASWGRGGRSSGTNATAEGAASPAGRTGSVAGALAFASSRFGSDSRAVCCGSGGKSSDAVTGGGVEVVADGVSGARPGSAVVGELSLAVREVEFLGLSDSLPSGGKGTESRSFEGGSGGGAGLAPGSVGCSRLIRAGVAAGCSETDSGARGVDAAMAFASTVTGGSGERRLAWAAASGLGLASGILAPGSVGCSRLIGAGVAAGCSETDSGARGVDAAMVFASTVTEGFAAIASGTGVG